MCKNITFTYICNNGTNLELQNWHLKRKHYRYSFLMQFPLRLNYKVIKNNLAMPYSTIGQKLIHTK